MRWRWADAVRAVTRWKFGRLVLAGALVAGLATAVALSASTWTAATHGGPAGSGDGEASRYQGPVAPDDAPSAPAEVSPDARDDRETAEPDGSAPRRAPTTSGRPATPFLPSPEPPPPIPGGPGQPGDLTGGQPDRVVVRTAALTLAVTDLPAASARVRTRAAGAGGFVAAEHSIDRSATFTLRVPATRTDEVISQLAAGGTVAERSEQTADVTDQLVDLDGRLATQRASVARVRALLDRADTVGEVVLIESELTQREAALESLQRRLSALSGRVAMSTLTVRLTPQAAPGPARDDSGFLAGLVVGWRAFLATGAAVLTALGAAVPFLVVLGLPGGIWVVARSLARRRRQQGQRVEALD